jgi:hypothetical protein
MDHSIQPRVSRLPGAGRLPRLSRLPRMSRLPGPCLLAVAALISGVLVAGCGGGSPGPTVTNSAATVADGGGASGSSAANSGSVASDALAFARCMRANGVPNFPDPSPGGGFLFNAGAVNPSSPAVSSARTRCQKLMPGGGPPAPGSTTHPSAQTVAKLVGIAQCMRQHGVPEFPDPRTSVPANPFGSAGAGVITDYDGAILLFPSTLNMESPAYSRAVATCGVLAGKLGRGPH